MRIVSTFVLSTITALAVGGVGVWGAELDPRDIANGLPIVSEGYCDQPYVVVTRDGNWLCVLTTGKGKEGDRGQHVVSTISTDHGKTWSQPVDIEPADGPEASWVVPLVTPGGRVYAFYDYNGDHVETLRGKRIRADMLGWYVYRYSDDNGRSWSRDRYRLPMRVTACDRANDWEGKVQIFWGICKPQIINHDAYFAFSKLGKYILDNGEGWLYRSDNILTERDPSKLRWDLWPEGDHGIRSPEFGSIQEEHNLVQVKGDTLYCVYRTLNGFPCHIYSTDGGRSWEKPEPMTYTPGGRPIKTPRACPKLWRTANGKYLFWFHHQGTKSFRPRNPAWIIGGVERNGRIHWSQPEILLYGPDKKADMSYPDMIEQDGRFWFTETQKTVARVHEVDKSLLEGLWAQGENKTVAQDGLILDRSKDALKSGPIDLAKGWDLSKSTGLTLDLRVEFDDLKPGLVLLDNRGENGSGVSLKTIPGDALRVELSDGTTKAALDSDPGLLHDKKLHHVTIIADAQAQLLSFVIDGLHNNGGKDRPFGWTRWHGTMGDVTGSGTLRVGPAVSRLRVYDRYLRTSEAVANFHAGR
jgi:hypothetical protein